MRVVDGWFTLTLVAFGLGAAPLATQVVAQPAPENQLTLDLNFIGASIGYAKRTGAERYLGVEVGAGGDFLNSMILSGNHFSQEGYLAYEGRDQAGNESLLELVHADFFLRYANSSRWHFDVGVRGSVFAHFDDSDDDPGFGGFAGVFFAPMWGGRRFKAGPRLLVGVFSEGDPEFGINFQLLTGRGIFSW